jgi:carboxylesterase type B
LLKIREITDILSAAVLVWIVGGGYTAGTKSSAGNPAGILASSIENNGDGVIFVEINYRLGLFVCYSLFFLFLFLVLN